jgi:ABC-type phosphate transport system substrate-binding protein
MTKWKWSLLRTTATAALLVCGANGAMATAVNGGGSTLAAPTYSLEFRSFHQSNPTATISYFASGSSSAQSAFLFNTSTDFSGVVTSFAVDFGASDANYTSSQTSTFKTTYGYPMIQIPTFGTPVTLAFNLSGLTTNGSLTLTNDQICGLASGKITNWSSISGSGSTSQVKFAYRSDGSGTSFLFTNHLASVCNSTNSNFFNTGFLWATHTPAGTTTFASLFPSNNPNSVTGASFVPGTGSSGVKAAITGSSNTIGYLSPDYTRIAPIHSSDTTYPVVAQVKATSTSTAYLPNTTNTSNALGTASLPSNVSDPSTWVALVPNPSTGYPIVGWTTWGLSSCYATAAVGTTLVSFLQNHYNVSGSVATYVDQITNNGFVPVTGSTDSAPVAAGTLAAYVNGYLLAGTSASGTLKIDNSSCPGTGGR